MIWLLPPAPHAPLPPVSKLHRLHTGRLRKKDNLLTREEGEEGAQGARSYDRKKAWSSINHSMLIASKPSQVLDQVKYFNYEYILQLSIFTVLLMYTIIPKMFKTTKDYNL